MYSVQQISRRWNVATDLVRRAFRGRAGIVNISGSGRPSWRIPASLLLAVMVERGYDRARAEEILRELRRDT